MMLGPSRGTTRTPRGGLPVIATIKISPWRAIQVITTSSGSGLPFPTHEMTPAALRTLRQTDAPSRKQGLRDAQWSSLAASAGYVRYGIARVQNVTVAASAARR